LNIGGGGNQPLPPGPRPLDPSLSAENQEISPHPRSSFPFFQPTTGPTPREPLFLVISSYTPGRIFRDFSSSSQPWAGAHGSPISLPSLTETSRPPTLIFCFPSAASLRHPLVCRQRDIAPSPLVFNFFSLLPQPAPSSPAAPKTLPPLLFSPQILPLSSSLCPPRPTQTRPQLPPSQPP
jgi:hypothetical protein